MKALCQPDGNGHCSQCGEPLREGWRRQCIAGPKPPRIIRRSVCEWLGQLTDSIALIQCSSCCGNVRKKHAVHDCAKHGACVPTGKNGAIVKIRGQVQAAVKCGECEFSPRAS